MTEDKKPDTLMVFSGKSLSTMCREGGSGYWVLDKDRASRRRYLVVVRNRHAPWSEDDEEHGIAWLVATIHDVVPGREDGRWLVQFDKYATLRKTKPWGSRNPVGYARLEDLGIDPSKLEWKVFERTTEPKVDTTPEGRPADLYPNSEVQALTFEQAKAGLALAMGIRPEQIEITIRA